MPVSQDPLTTILSLFANSSLPQWMLVILFVLYAYRDQVTAFIKGKQTVDLANKETVQAIQTTRNQELNFLQHTMVELLALQLSWMRNHMDTTAQNQTKILEECRRLLVLIASKQDINIPEDIKGTRDEFLRMVETRLDG